MSDTCSHGTNCTRQPCAHMNGTCACRSDRHARRETADRVSELTDDERDRILSRLLFSDALDALRDAIHEEVAR